MSDRGSMDGFVRRSAAVPRRLGQPSLNPMAAGAAAASGATGLPRTNAPGGGLGGAQMLASSAGAIAVSAPRPVSRGDIDDSLKAIDKDKKKKPNKYDPYVRARRRKLIKRIVLILLVLIGIAAAYFAVSAVIAGTKVFKGNIFAALTQQNTPLQQDSYGRTNILIFGTSEDDPGHDGANLTDSIMILTLDQNKKVAAMISVPRDLWVQYDKSCSLGYAGKINATYECGLDNTNNDASAAAEQFANKVGEVFGISLQYYVHVNYTVVKDTVDAVGGVDVNIQGDGAKGIYDTNFDWNCPSGRPYTCKNVYYPTDGVYHLNGTQALYLARARADAGSYSYKDFGLARGNFDREQNQQKILKALQAKAKSAGTLSNPVTVLNLINSLGDNIRTNFQTSEITTLVNLAKTINGDSIQSLDLAAPGSALVTTGTGPDGSSIVKPVAGLLDYTGLQAYAKAVLSGDTSVLENATVAVYNGSQTAGVAGSTATTLKNAGFIVTDVNDATTAYTPKYTLYDQSGGKKPATLAKLQQQLGVKVTAGTPTGVSTTADFVVVVGADISASGSASSTTNGSSQ